MRDRKNILRNKAWRLALPLAALAAVAVLKKERHHLMPRRDPRIPFEEFDLQAADGTAIKARMVPGSGEGAVIVAHPAVTGQRYSHLVDMVERLAVHFDVFTFDFRGHGGSGGRLDLNLEGPLDDLDAVVSWVRYLGYSWVGALGFSLGGMCAILHGAQREGLDAVAAVSAPPLLPDIELYRRWLPAWSLFLRFLGARFSAANPGGPQPMEAVSGSPNIPFLVVHAGNEAFYPREEMEDMMGKLGTRAEFWEIPGAAHTELAGREDDLVGWIRDRYKNRNS